MSRTKIDIILKKILAVVLSMAVVFTAIPVNFAYGEEAAAPGITVDSAEAYPGDSVTVSVRATDLNAIGGLEYALKYDADVMTVKSTSKGSLVSGAISDINSSEAGIVKASVASVDGISGSSVLMSVTFDITKDAAAGSYKLEPTVSDVYDTSFNSVTVSKSPGTLTVKKKDETPQAASFHTEISKSQIDEGETFTYQVNSSDIGKLAGGDFIIVYDAEYLKAESVSAGKALQAENAVCSVNDKTAGRIKISCAGIDAIDAPYGTTLAEVTFRGKAPSKGKTEIKFTAEGLTDVDLKSMTASACTDSITVNQKQEEVVKPKMQLRWDGKITDKRNITVDVSLPEGCPVSAGDFVISYNKEQIVCTGAETDGELSGKGGIIVTKEETGNGAVRFSYVNPDPSNEAVVLLHLTFAVQGKFTGIAELTPSGKDVVDKAYNDIELDYAPVELDIPKIDISGSTVTGIEKEYVYAGKAITPEVIIEGLTKGQDYEIAYSSNLNVGTATVTITGKGNYTGKIEKTFGITPAELTGVKVTGYEGTYDGKSHTVTVEGLSEDAKITYSTEKDGEYTTDVPSRTNAGTTEVYYKVSRPNYNTYTGKVDIVVNPADISKKEVTGLKESYVYTGKAITPEVTIEGLTEKQDFEVSYSSNLNVGTATVTITGKGNYTGKIEKTFSITPAELTGVKVTGYEGTYDGKSHTVTVEGLPEDSEITYAIEKDGKYTTDVPSRTEVGTTEVYYKVSKANYTDLTGKVSIVITPAELSGLKVTGYEGTYDGKSHTVTVEGLPEDAKITYSLSKDGEYAADAPSRTNVGTTEVYYKVSKANYADLTGKVSIVINLADISKKEVTGLKDSYVYTGKAITPEVTIEGLTEKQDYEVSYSDNLTVGTAKVTITGTGNYTGKIEKTFSITPAELTGVKVTGYEGHYDGKSHTITVEGLPEDAEITYATEKDGKYTAEAPSRTNTGTTEVYYKVSRPNYDTYTGKVDIVVNPADISKKEVTGLKGSYVYTGKAIAPELTIEGLTEKQDYEVAYSSNINVGTATVTITGTGNYTGKIEKTFSITPAELTGVKVTGYEGSYDGKSHTITVEGLPEDAEITYSTEKDGEYTTESPSRTEVGTMEVYYKVSKVNYADLTGKVSIVITPAELSGLKVTGYEGSYDGKSHTITVEGLPNDAKITYSTEKDGEYTTEAPSRINAGTTEVYYKVSRPNYDTYTGKVDIVVNAADISKKEVTGLKDSYVYTGKAITPEVTIEGLTEKQDYEVSYSSNVNVGTATVTIIGKGNYTGKIEKTFSITPAELTGVKVTGYEGTYDGKSHTITVEGLPEDAEITYATEKDGKYTTEAPSRTNVGTTEVYYKVSRPNYDTYTGKVDIVVNAADISKKEVTGLKDSYVYTGKAITPEMTIEGLTEKQDYEVSYSSNVNVGTATVTITGKGNYTGKIEKTFSITPAELSGVKVTGYEGTYDGKSHTVTVEGLPEDAEITYSTSKDGEYTAEAPSRTNVGTTEVYYKVSKANYETMTGKVSVVINPANISKKEVTGLKDSYVYTGKAITPEVTIEGLTEKQDYEVSYSSNVNVGTATVTITGKGNYTGKIEKTFSITPAELTGVKVTGYEGTYDGKSHTITVEGLPEDAEITYATEKDGKYTTEAPSRTEVGTTEVYYKVSKANYADLTGKVLIVITPAELSGLKVTGYEGTYDGKSHTVTVEGLPEDAKITYSTEKDGKYTTEALSRTNAGTTEVYYKVSRANYDTYSGKVDIVVTPADISKKELTGLKESYVYTGKVITPEVTVDGLTEGQEYEVAYSDNVNVGSAKVTITGTGNYTGKIEKTFSITPAELTGVKVTGYEGTYDGKSHTITVEGLPEDAEITYATEKDGEYTTEAPSRTEVGTTEVYYKVSKANHKALECSVRLIIKPGLPSSVSSVLYGYHDIKVYWNKVSGVDGYYVYYKKSSASKYSYVRTSATSRNFAKLSDGVRYDFRVVPYVNTDEGIYKATGYKSTSVYTLKKTGKPSVKRYSSKSVKVSWKSIAGGSGYQISRSTTSKGTKIVSTISTTKGKSKVISAAKNKKYYYKVRAYKTVRLNGKTRKIYAPWSAVRKY